MFFVAVWSAACHAAGSGSALTGRRGVVMPDLILDWGLFGSNGTNLNDGGTVDTGGVEVTLGFNAQDGDAFARYLEFDQYVDTASGETFDPMSALKLFGEGGEGGADDTSTTTIDFSASDDAFSDEVQNVSFRINDLDLGQGGADYTDIVTVRAFDAAGNPVEVAFDAGWGHRDQWRHGHRQRCGQPLRDGAHRPRHLGSGGYRGAGVADRD